MLQLVQALPNPLAGLWGPFPPQSLAHLTDPLGSMGKVEDEHRLGTVIIDKALQPIRPIHHRRYLPAVFQALALDFNQGQMFKAFGIHQTGEVGDVLRKRPSLPTSAKATSPTAKVRTSAIWGLFRRTWAPPVSSLILPPFRKNLNYTLDATASSKEL